MTTYRVYYRDGFRKEWIYIEVSDALGRKKVQEVRRIAREEYGITSDKLIKIVKDC